MADTKVLRTKYLIIGNSAGGIGAAEAIRDVDKQGLITIVSDEPYPAYSRPFISKYLTKERTIEGILFRPRDFYSQNNVNLLTGEKVSHVELSRNIAYLQNREQVLWQKLLLATGGMPIIPKIHGIEKKGIFKFLTIKDADEVAAFIKPGQRAVVIGGGLIGISVTEALKKCGLNVTIVEMKDRVLNTILDEEGSSIVEGMLRKSDIKIVTNHTVSTIVGNATTEGVILDNNEKIPCDLVIVAIGVLPRVELARNTEIKVNRGIVVDRCMSTTIPDVYACGDAAEAYDFIYGSNRVTPIWPNAYIGGRVAGFNMAGVKTPYSGGTAMNSLTYFGLDIATAGIATAPDDNTYEIMSKQGNGTYKKLILHNDYITGMVFINDIEKSGMMFGLMRERVNVRDFKKELLSDNFGLAFLPKQLWQERLGVSSLDTNARFTSPRENEEPLACK